ncbi:LysR family transcriptional regulator [Leucothrix arctica]|uniref:LysR family transcriptional regulator n=1 Tax=Leucothrix arctica TaxID=1481894 RepID=A0A317CGW0_9GAMM|nr:LysR family transcriptional regulator [Leucothrix arctica]PWQ97786.1 LysR family transcriptional regulator [Leucothrix arctica]
MKNYNLEAFIVVAQEENLTRAAERLYLTQSALSLQIKKLQEQLQLTLFERVPRGMKLTSAGQRLLPIAEIALQAQTDFGNAAAELNNAVSGHMRLGTILDPEFLRLGNFLSELTKRHPAVMLELTHGISGSIASMVEHKKIDAAFALGEPDLKDLHEKFHLIKLTDFSYRVVAPAGWKKLIEGKDWRDLAQLPWIGTPPSSIHYRLLSKVFEDLGVKQNIISNVDLEPSMMELVRSGVGLSLARHSHALQASHRHGVVMSNEVSLDASLCFICRKDRYNDALIQATLKTVKNIWLNSDITNIKVETVNLTV